MTVNPEDIRQMAARYAETWSSGSPEAVAAFYEPDGRIAINREEALVGRAAITEMAQGFYDEFPDLVVHLDDISTAGENAIFLWSLEGTHSETGNFVKVGGWKEWTVSDNCLVAESLDHYDAEEYDRQVAGNT